MQQFIFKFAKNCQPGDLVVPPDGEPMAHAYWKVKEITTDLVRYEVGYANPHKFTVVGDLNDLVIVRPTAPLHIRPELFQQYYGPGGFWDPWPWDYKKPMWLLRREIGEDLAANVHERWTAPAKLERPELAIRKMHERAVLKFYDGSEDSVCQTHGPAIGHEVGVQHVVERHPEVSLEAPVGSP